MTVWRIMYECSCIVSTLKYVTQGRPFRGAGRATILLPTLENHIDSNSLELQTS